MLSSSVSFGCAVSVAFGVVVVAECSAALQLLVSSDAKFGVDSFPPNTADTIACPASRKSLAAS